MTFHRVSLLSTVVDHPDFYYHLTTIDGIDLPHLAFSVTELQLINNFFCPAHRRRPLWKSWQTAAEYGFSGG